MEATQDGEHDGTRLDRAWKRAIATANGENVSVRAVCEAAVSALDVTGAGLVVGTGAGRPEVRHSTDPVGALLSEIEVTVGEGPVTSARRLRVPVLVEDFDAPANARRWPLFGPLAVQAGVRALFAVPLTIGMIDVGALELHRDEPAPLEAALLGDALAYGELVLLLLLDEQAGIAGSDGRMPGISLRSSQVHQATGMVAVQLDVGLEDAFARLRARAFAEARPLSELAADVVARRFRFEHEGDPK